MLRALGENFNTVFWNSELLFVKSESSHLNLLIWFYAKTVETEDFAFSFWNNFRAEKYSSVLLVRYPNVIGNISSRFSLLWHITREE